MMSDTHQEDKEEEYSGKDNRNRRKGVEKNVQCIRRYIRQLAWLRHRSTPGDAAKGLGRGSFLLNLVRALLKAFPMCSTHEFDNQQFLCFPLKKKI